MWPWMLPSSIQKVWFISPVTAGAVPVKASTSSGLFQWVPVSAGSAFTLLPWGDGGWAPGPVRQHPSCLPASPLSASIPPVRQHPTCPPASSLSSSISPVHRHLPCPPASHLSTRISLVASSYPAEWFGDGVLWLSPHLFSKWEGPPGTQEGREHLSYVVCTQSVVWRGIILFSKV